MLNISDRFRDIVRQILREYGLNFLLQNNAEEGDFLVYDGNEWVGEKLEEWEPHDY